MKNAQESLAEFLSSVIEIYKIKHRLDGAQAANRLAQYGALGFLEEGYDMLHTQSLAYIVGEVDAFLAKRGVDG